jgi:lipopolysaccharide assembly outer membrane protein LptD (OstA)
LVSKASLKIYSLPELVNVDFPRVGAGKLGKMPVSLLLFLLVNAAPDVEFSAKRALFLEGEARVILVDSARVRYGNTVLEADSIEFHRREGLLLAYRDPLLILSGDSLTGDSLRYRTDTEQGISFGGRTHVEEGWITGRRMFRVSDDVLHIEDGTFTTCDEDPPHYWFSSRRIKVIRDDMAYVAPIVLNIRGIPVMAAPFWLFPLKKGRKSGLLTPRFGYNSSDGTYFRNIAYYLVINNFMDLTLSGDFIEKRGPRVGLEFVYNLFKTFEGNVAYTLAQELDPNRRRWSLFGSHLQHLGRNTSLRGQANFVSDVLYVEEYSEEKTEWLKSEMRSYLNLSHRWSFASLDATLDETRDLTRETRSAKLPDLKLNLFSFSLGLLRLSGQSRATRVLSGTLDSTESRYAWDNSLNASAQLRLLQYLQVQPSLTVRSTVFDRDEAGNENVRRDIYTASAALSTVIYGLSDFGLGPFERFRHTLKPEMGLSYTPEVDQDHLDTFGGFGRVGAQKRARFSLSNTFEGKTPSGSKLTLLTADGSLSYDMRAEEEPFSPLSLSFEALRELPVHSRLSVTQDLYDTDQRTFNLVTQLSLTLGGIEEEIEDTLMDLEESEVLRPWKLSLSHSYLKSGTERQRLSGRISGQPTRHWRIEYDFTLDLDEQRLIDQSLILSRDLHCWAASLRWSKFGDVFQYDFKIWIKGLPDVKIQRSFFEAFLPD